MSLARKISLREGERLIRVQSRYGLVSWWKHLVAFMFLAVSSFFMFQLFSYGWWGYTLYGIGMVIGSFLLFRGWFFDHFNIFVVTSERAVDIHRVGWFDQVISSVSHKEIKDVSVRKKGVLANVFNYGSVIIQSKSEKFFLEIIQIHDPQELQALLQEVGDQYRQDRKLLNTDVIYRNFIKIIPELSDEQLTSVSRLIMDQFEIAEEEGWEEPPPPVQQESEEPEEEEEEEIEEVEE